MRRWRCARAEPWNETDPANNYRRDVRRVVESIGLDPDIYGLYAFRHTSITRMLLAGCAYRKSNPAILMVQSAQDRAADDIPGPLNAAMDRGILVQ